MSGSHHLSPSSQNNNKESQFASERFILFFNFGLLLMLTFFGTPFSKFRIMGPLYLHDVLLLLGAGIALLLKPRSFPYRSVIIIVGISLIYLVYSLFHYSSGPLIILRQFALFGYLACYYLLNRHDSNDHSKMIERFLISFSWVAIALQCIFIIYLVAFGEFDPFDFHNHYWYSPAVVIGLIVAAATVLLYVKNIVLRFILFCFVLLLCWTTGHASAQLSVLAILGTYGILKLAGWKKLFPVMGGIAIVIALLNFAPQFKDKNSDWRVLTWGYLLKELSVEYYGVLGKGFGAPYFSVALEEYLYKKISSTAIQERGKPDERYLSPPHNSFVTIFFSIGIIPGMLLFMPFRYILHDLRKTMKDITKINGLLLLSLIGLTVWTAFNVVLELPHAAGFFWFVYFSYWGLMKKSP